MKSSVLCYATLENGILRYATPMKSSILWYTTPMKSGILWYAALKKSSILRYATSMKSSVSCYTTPTESNMLWYATSVESVSWIHVSGSCSSVCDVTCVLGHSPPPSACDRGSEGYLPQSLSPVWRPTEGGCRHYCKSKHWGFCIACHGIQPIRPLASRQK
jgi:hypothetical protein